ncbi:MAG: EAL domain-containing protein [Cyanobacteria bacterium P01_E01_bin.45]
MFEALFNIKNQRVQPRKSNLHQDKGISLRLLFTGPFVLELIIAMTAIGYFSLQNGQRAVNQLARKLHIETTDRVQQQLNHFLGTPHLINRINASKITLRQYELDDVEGLELHFWQQMQLFPAASYIYVGTADGIFMGAEQVSDGLPHVAYWTSENPNGHFETYATNSDGTRGELLSVVDDYNLSTRPWFVNAREARQPIWGDIYVWAAPYVNLALPAVQPLYDKLGQLQAVFAVDLSLQTISEFLQTLEVGINGEVFILENNGIIVSSSDREKIYSNVDDTIQRLSGRESSSPMIRGTTTYLEQEYGSLQSISEAQQFRFSLDGTRHFARVTPYQDEWGLDWLIVVVVPENDFMGRINANTRMTVLLGFISLFIAIVIGSLIAQQVVKPIEQLSATSHAISMGEWDRPISGGEIEELRVLSSSFDRMAKQLIHDARYDSLTHLLNRNSFLARAKELLAKAWEDQDYLFAVLFIDFDRFKDINDSYGHIVGDRFLFTISQILQDLLAGTSTVARLGGDEFAILVENIESVDDATDIATQIREQLQKPLEIQSRKFFTTASIGIVLGDSSYQSELDLLRDADIAMYEAKHAGKDRFSVFTESMYQQSLKSIRLENDLRLAVARQEFELHYQPIIDLETDTLSGFEALLRWNHPTDGLIPPARFIPTAEEIGIIIPLGEWVLFEACRQLKEWQDKGLAAEDTSIHVNLSGKQIFDPAFLSKVDAILEETQLKGQCIHLEITESVLMTRSSDTIEIFKYLRKRGLHLSIDDFGTGYSSLSYIQQLPIDILKIPRCFVSSIDKNSERYEITRAIVSLAQTLNIELIAEGIEEYEERDMLKRLGCERGQGFLFDRPLTVQSAERLMSSLS